MSISFEPKMEGTHVRVTVRSGAAGSRALCGSLLLRPSEWEFLLACLDLPHHPGRLEDGACDVFVLGAGSRGTVMSKADIEVLARAADVPYDTVRFIVRLTERKRTIALFDRGYPLPPTQKSETSSRG